MDPVNEGLYGVSQGRQHSTEEISLVQTAVGGDSKALAARQRCDHAGAVKSKCASGQDDTQHTVCSGRFPQIFSGSVQHLWFVGGDLLVREPRVHGRLADAITTQGAWVGQLRIHAGLESHKGTRGGPGEISGGTEVGLVAISTNPKVSGPEVTQSRNRKGPGVFHMIVANDVKGEVDVTESSPRLPSNMG